MIHTGVLSPLQPAGRPLIITIFFTPSMRASSNVFFVTSISLWDGYAACVAADALNRSRGTGKFLPIEMMDKPDLYK